MLVVAHRGANREAYENSWQAFDLAVNAGSTRIELDVFLTIDGGLVIHHDQQHVSVTGKTTDLTNSLKSQIELLTLPNGDSLPFLAETLERYIDQIEFNIEIKATINAGEYSNRVAASIKETIEPFYRRNFIVLSSFSEAIIGALAPSKVPLALLVEPFRRYRPRWWFRHQMVNKAELLKCQFLHPEAVLVDSELVKLAHDRDLKVVPYVTMRQVENHHFWKNLVDCGVDGLCTNQPRELNKWLHSYK